MEQLTQLITNRDREDSMTLARDNNNVPIQDPDYYSQTRRYYGRWAYCVTSESLMVIPEYVELYRKAELGDVEAMLNIAVGFLEKNIAWNENKLINIPAYQYRGEYHFQKNAYDSRYYFWILKAVSTANQKWQNGEYVPLKYIATAIWESYLFLFYYHMSGYSYWISGINDTYNNETRQYVHAPIYTDQFSDISAVDGSKIGSYNWRVFLPLAEHVFGNYHGNIVAAVHSEANIETLQKIDYMMLYSKAVKNEERIMTSKGNKRQKSECSKYSAEDVGHLERLICKKGDVKVGDTIRSVTFDQIARLHKNDGFYRRIYLDGYNCFSATKKKTEKKERIRLFLKVTIIITILFDIFFASQVGIVGFIISPVNLCVLIGVPIVLGLSKMKN